MDKSPLRQALTSMSRTLADKGDYRPIFLALKSAMPDVAAKHLVACSSDETLAGATLAFGFGDTNNYATLAHYLTGDPKIVLSQVQGFMEMMERMSAIAARQAAG